MIKVLLYLDNCVIGDVADYDPNTLSFWNKYRLRKRKFQFVVSDYVYAEAEKGSPKHVAERKQILKGLKRLAATAECARVAFLLRKGLKWGADRQYDALHVACASLYGANFLVTWDKGMLKKNELDIRTWLTIRGLDAPVILTPSDFLSRTNPPASNGRNTRGVRESRAIRRRLARMAKGDFKTMLRLLADPSVT